MNKKYNHEGCLRLKIGEGYVSVGKFGNDYACEILTGVCNLPEYYPITLDEFNTFEKWYSDAS